MEALGGALRLMSALQPHLVGSSGRGVTAGQGALHLYLQIQTDPTRSSAT